MNGVYALLILMGIFVVNLAIRLTLWWIEEKKEIQEVKNKMISQLIDEELTDDEYLTIYNKIKKL